MLFEILDDAVEKKASDIHFTNGLHPTYRVNGELYLARAFCKMTVELIKEQIRHCVPNYVEAEYQSRKYIDCSLQYKDYRFRVHVYKQRGSEAIAIRLIPSIIPSLEELHLPEVIRKFTILKNGLVLVTGTTGSGKSTTLASIIDEINHTQKKHILTIEDPVEFIHNHRGCMISQREVGQDVPSFSEAIRSAMREDPDIILLGEMRDLDTIKQAVSVAETGHLVFATLHTKSVAESVDRIIDVFPANQQQQIRTQLANVLQGAICQTLLPKIGGGRVPACEVLIATKGIRSMIKEQRPPSAILDSIQSNYQKLGSQTMTQSVAYLYKNDLITYDQAKEYAENESDLKGTIMSMGDKT